jgi:hypothetical protein
VLSDMFTNRLLSQWASTIKIQISVNIIIIWSKCNLISPWYSGTNCSFSIKQQSLTQNKRFRVANNKTYFHLSCICLSVSQLLPSLTELQLYVQYTHPISVFLMSTLLETVNTQDTCGVISTVPVNKNVYIYVSII